MGEGHLGIALYTQDDCIRCIEVKAFLAKHKVEVELIPLNTDVKTDLIMENVFDDPPILRGPKWIMTSTMLYTTGKLDERLILSLLA